MPTSDLSFFIPYFLPQVIYFTIKYFSLRIVVSDSGFRIPVSGFCFLDSSFYNNYRNRWNSIIA